MSAAAEEPPPGGGPARKGNSGRAGPGPLPGRVPADGTRRRGKGEVLLLPLTRGPSRPAGQGAGTRRRRSPAALPATAGALLRRAGGAGGGRGGVTSRSGCPSVRSPGPPSPRRRASLCGPRPARQKATMAVLQGLRVRSTGSSQQICPGSAAASAGDVVVVAAAASPLSRGARRRPLGSLLSSPEKLEPKMLMRLATLPVSMSSCSPGGGGGSSTSRRGFFTGEPAWPRSPALRFRGQWGGGGVAAPAVAQSARFASPPPAAAAAATAQQQQLQPQQQRRGRGPSQSAPGSRGPPLAASSCGGGGSPAAQAVLQGGGSSSGGPQAAGGGSGGQPGSLR